jgi:hypothetical protein
MQYFVSWSRGYGDCGEEVFDTKEACLNWINERAMNSEFIFSVIYGKTIKLKSIEIVKAYEFE